MEFSDGKISEKRAKMIYGKLWDMFIMFRTKNKYGFKKGFHEKLKERKAKEARLHEVRAEVN